MKRENSGARGSAGQESTGPGRIVGPTSRLPRSLDADSPPSPESLEMVKAGQGRPRVRPFVKVRTPDSEGGPKDVFVSVGVKGEF